MAIAGFNGTDPWPTLAVFEQYVADGRIHYFIGGRSGGGTSDSSAITQWVESNFTATGAERFSKTRRIDRSSRS